MVAKKLVPLVVIVGETASGKSVLALQLAQLFKGEIICADAWTLRRQADIGTAKPSKEEQQLVPHHLLDVIEPDEPFSASDFKQLANEAIESIGARNKLPIMVGGTGLYIDGVIYDYSFLPYKDESLRKRLSALDLPQLLKIAEDESINANKVDKNNKRRLIRLIETKGAVPTKGKLREQTLVIGLKMNRFVLEKRIATRTDAMISKGLEKEVFELSRAYGWECEALKAIGYKEWHDYFLGNISREEVRKRIIKNSLDFTKRQRTWFKRNKSIHWFDTPVKLTDIVELITTKLLS